MTKTIQSLNSKMWYRLLKVIYIFSFIVVSVITVFFINILYGTPTSEPDNDNTKIICNLGNKNTYTIAQVFDGFDRYFEPTGYYKNDSLKSKIQTKCEISMLEKFDLAEGKIQDSGALVLSSDGKTFHATGFTIKEEFKYKGGLGAVINYSALALVLLALFFEILKRTFYYIVFGTLRPMK